MCPLGCCCCCCCAGGGGSLGDGGPSRGLSSLDSLRPLSLTAASCWPLSWLFFSLSLPVLLGLASFLSLTASLARRRSVSPLREALLGFFRTSSSSSEELGDSSEEDSSLDSFLDLRDTRFLLLDALVCFLRRLLGGGASSSESLLDERAGRALRPLLRGAGSDWLLSLSLRGRRRLEEGSDVSAPFFRRGSGGSSSSSCRRFLLSLCRSFRDLRDLEPPLSLTALWCPRFADAFFL